MKQLNNFVIKNRTRETGKEIVKFWQSMGVDTTNYEGRYTEEEGDISVYYGIVNGNFNNYSLHSVKINNANVVELPEDWNKPIKKYEELFIGKYKTFINKIHSGYFLLVYDNPNKVIYTQFGLSNDDMISVLGYESQGDFPYCIFEEDLRKLINYLRLVEQVHNKNKNKSMKNRFPFSLSPDNARRIIDIACDAWKEKLSAVWAVNIVLGKSSVVEEGFYNQMRKACTPTQHEVFDEIFGSDKPAYRPKIGECVYIIEAASGAKGANGRVGQVTDVGAYHGCGADSDLTVRIGNSVWAVGRWEDIEIRPATKEEIKKATLPADQTPCLVRDHKTHTWELRYADGEGMFYDNGKRSGNTTGWNEWIDLTKADLNNIPE